MVSLVNKMLLILINSGQKNQRTRVPLGILLCCFILRTKAAPSSFSDVLPQPTVSLVVANQFQQEDPVVVYSSHSFYMNCSVLPQFPGGHFSLVFPGVKHSLSLNQTAVNHSTVFAFDSAEKSHSGKYSCIYHNTVSGLIFSSQSEEISIAVEETQSEVKECVFSDHPQYRRARSQRTANHPRGEGRDNSTVRCSSATACFVLWKQRPGGEILLLKQGCWVSQTPSDCPSEHCLATALPANQKDSYRFCCCSRDLCNVHFK